MADPARQAGSAADLEKEFKSHCWGLAQLVLFGVIALVLGPFGELSLTRSSPLWNFLGLAYGAWQVGYFIGLTVLCLAWLVAFARRLSMLADCRARLANRRRADAERQAREERRRAGKIVVEEAPVIAPPLGGRSKKFDY